MKRLLCVIIVGLVFAIPARPDSRSHPWTKVSASANGQYYVEITPDTLSFEDWIMAEAIVYKVVSGPCDEEVWRANMWWSGPLHLSNDGEYLVWLGARSTAGLNGQYSLAFYRRGELIRGYTYSELVEDTDALIVSVGGAVGWRSSEHRPHYWGDGFRIVTIDGIEYVFSLDDGSISKRTKLD